ncbi:MAG: hypothetical protein HRU02_06065 [Myxococcales bacterium]|nr:hypothetical protein [Myxococcales bacterium]
MPQSHPIRQIASRLGCLLVLAAPPAAAQTGQSIELPPAPVCRSTNAEYLPRIELAVPPLDEERLERGRGIVVLNGRGYNYAGGMQPPAALAPLPSPNSSPLPGSEESP